jgi:putative hydrolase of the HAD superfamily
MWARERIGKMTAKIRYRLLTIDLDETLWPCTPTILQAEAALHTWLERCAPRLTDACDQDVMRVHRRDVAASRPEIAHDLTQVRLESLRGLLAAYGYDVALADQAMSLFLEQRNRVEPYADVIPGLRALGANRRLVSVTNGNADVRRTPLSDLIHFSLTAADVGAQKPDPAMFLGALKWAKTPPDRTLHLGDDPYLDVEAARRLGMQAVWVNRSGKPWPDELAPPTVEVVDLVELRRWLEEFDGAF